MWVAFAALAAATAVSALIEDYIHPPHLVMVYMAAVVVIAYRAGRVAALASVAGCILLYDFIFVPPRWSLKPTDPQYWLSFLVMLLVGAIISDLAARSREQALKAEARARRAQALNDVANELALARDASVVQAALVNAIERALGIGATVLLGTHGTLRGTMGVGRLQVDLRTALSAMAHGKEMGAGTERPAGEDLLYMPMLGSAGESLGVVVVEPLPTDQSGSEDSAFLRALVGQGTIALERSIFEQRSIAAAVETEAERMRSTLLAGISHDFRTPLTTIVGSATLLLEQGTSIDDEDRIRLTRGLLAEARRLHSLSSDLLDLTRFEAGAVKPTLEWCPADDLLEEVVSVMRPRLAEHRIDVFARPETLVWGDPLLLGQAITNLLDNAARHSPAGSEIHVSISTGDAQWTLVVQDQGPGVPAGEEQTVFQRFHRASDSAGPGSKGLGLAICAAVAQLHGGSIRVTNHGGARFEMNFPQPAIPRALAQELA
ncbi:MAG TPA: DUF4118 domain-containing protein [Burkholderiaceae bacterium]|nr:DUF4118 domain-containing protein [Burkholderiaceae bacterium]